MFNSDVDSGASRVMIGTWLCGTYESPGDIVIDGNGDLYKENWGMASGRAVADRSADLDPFDQAKKAFFREGISRSKIYLKEGKSSVGEIVTDIVTGVRSAFTYVGATCIRDFQEQVVVGVQTRGGYHEGTPHGKVVR